MPFLPSEDKPSFLNKPDKPEPVPKPIANENDIFKGKAWGNKWDLDKRLEKEIKKELKLSGPEADKKARELKERMIPKNSSSVCISCNLA